MWDLPGPGLEPVSPALAGKFLTTVPPRNPWALFLESVLSSAPYVARSPDIPLGIYDIPQASPEWSFCHCSLLLPGPPIPYPHLTYLLLNL